MSLMASCPQCGQRYKLPDNAAGRAVRCKACQTKFTLPADSGDDPFAEADQEETAVRSAATAALPAPRRRAPAFSPVRRPQQGGFIDFGGSSQTVALLLIAIAVLPTAGIVVWRSLDVPVPLVPISMFVGGLICFLLVLVPLVLLGIWLAGKVLAFELPEHPLVYLTACLATPTAAGYIGWLLAGQTGAALGGPIGLLLSFVVFVGLFRLRVAQAALGYLFGAIALIPGVFISAMLWGLLMVPVGLVASQMDPEGMETMAQAQTARKESSGSAEPQREPGYYVDDQKVSEAEYDAARQRAEEASAKTLEKSRQHRERVLAEMEQQRQQREQERRQKFPPPTAAAANAREGLAVMPSPELAPLPRASAPSSDLVAPALDASDLVASAEVWENAASDATLLYPPGGSQRVGRVEEEGERLVLRLFDPQTLNPVGEVTLPEAVRQPAEPARYALSADGSHVAFVTDFPRLQLQVLNVADGQPVFTHPLAAAGANVEATLAGLVGNDQVYLLREQGFDRGIEAFDLTKGQKLMERMLAPPSGFDQTLLIHPRGRQLAVFSDEGRGPTIEALHLYRNNSSAPRIVPVRNIASASGARRQGATYSPDGNQIAAFYTRGEQGIIVRWDARTGDLLGETFTPAGVRTEAPFFDGNGLLWLAGDSADSAGRFVIFGSSVVDAATGQLLGDLGAADVRDQKLAAEGVIVLQQGNALIGNEAVLQLR